MKKNIKKMIFLVLCLMAVGLFNITVSAANSSYTFNFNMLEVSGRTNGIFHQINSGKKPVASGSWYLARDYTVSDVDISSTYEIELKRVDGIFTTSMGRKYVGSKTLKKGYKSTSSSNYSVTFNTVGKTSGQYYLVHYSGTKYVYKIGSGTLIK